MTAKELTLLLQTLPPEMKVVVRGYEDGYNDIKQLKPVKLKKEPNTQWYYGEYFANDSEPAVAAVEVFGENED